VRIRSLLLALSPMAGLGVMAWVSSEANLSLRAIIGGIPFQAHLLALGAFVLSLAGRGARIALLARGLGRRLTLTGAMATQLTGEAAAAVTPSRSGSDPARILFLRKLGVDVPTGMAILVGEMVAEGVVLLSVVPLLAILLPSHRMASLGALPYALGALALPFMALLLVRLPKTRTPPRLWSTLGLKMRRWRWLRVGTRQFRSKVRTLTRLRPRTLLRVLLVSLLHLLAKLAILPVLVLATVPGTPLGPLVAWPLFLLYTASLLPPPGGGGGVELAFTAALGSALDGASLATALLWWRLYTFYLGALVGGAVLFVSLGRLNLSTVGGDPKDGGPQGTLLSPVGSHHPGPVWRRTSGH
jgi:glycosyltransferase 2 family protein